MKIARVFPTRTNMSPRDPDAYFGEPGLFTPHYDQVHISVTFTWDLPKIGPLIQAWRKYGEVKIGGPAMDDKGDDFSTGRYIRKGVTITSRGCPNNCPWCFVPRREGKLRELPIVAGNIVQDNNLLACSRKHISKVFEMLRGQRQIEFSGGFESARLEDWIVEELRGLKIRHIWLSYDSPQALRELMKAVCRLRQYFSRDKVRCYVLIGYHGDTLGKAESRLRTAWNIGTLPFAMRYRTASLKQSGTFLFSGSEWVGLTRRWSRPAIIRAMMKDKPSCQETQMPTSESRDY